MSRLHSLTTKVLSLPLRGTLRWGQAGVMGGLEHLLIYARLSDGTVGVAEAPVRPTIYGETLPGIQAAIGHYLAPKLIGLDVHDTDAIATVFAHFPNNHTAKGATDIALSDARAVSKGTTLFEAERGPQRQLRVSFILGIDTLQTMLDEARIVFERGVRVFKIKIGRDPAHDQQIVEALQHEFAGEDVTLYADANEGLSPDTAAKELARLAALGLAYVEEPLPVEMIGARAALKRAAILPIIADDSCFTLRDLRRELDLDTFDILNIKTARSGFRESHAMLGLARSADKGVMLGSQASSGLGTYHGAIFASKAGVTHPSELSFPLKLEDDVLTQPLHYQSGILDVDSLADVHLRPELTTP